MSKEMRVKGDVRQRELRGREGGKECGNARRKYIKRWNDKNRKKEGG
jgi:hypothetical protein